MSDHYRRRLSLRLTPPEKEDVGAWVAAIVGVFFTLAVMFWAFSWNPPTRMASNQANTTTVEKTNPDQPPPHSPQ